MSNFDRRGFLRLLGGAAMAVAMEEAIPFGRVWSFPSRIVIANRLSMDELNAVTIKYIEPILADNFFTPDMWFLRAMEAQRLLGGGSVQVPFNFRGSR